MRDFKTVMYLVSGIILSLVCLSCEVKTAIAPRIDLVPSHLAGIFNKQSIRLTNNRFFLWPENVTSEQVSRVLEVSDEMDDLDRKLFPMHQRLANLEVETAPLLEGIQSKELALQKKTNAFSKKALSLKKIENDLSSAPGESDKRKLEAAKALLEGEIHQIQADQALLEAEAQKLRESPLLIEKNLLTLTRKENEELGRKYLEEVKSIVVWYDTQPTSVAFQFDDAGVPQASISGWVMDRDEGVRDFSTKSAPEEKPTIENLKYDEVGGVYEFDVRVYEDSVQSRLRETYSFRIARTNYGSEDGKIYFSGKIKRLRSLPGGGIEERQGAAKLVDKIN